MRVVYFGTGDIGLPALQWLVESGAHEVAGVITQPDKPAGRAFELRASPVKELASAHGMPVFQPNRMREETAIEQVRALRPELIVVMAYGQILPKAILDLPPIACLNIHASLLPRHRGAAPVQAAIAAGDRESGITIMYMDEGLDTGDILLQRAFPLRRRETGGSLHARLSALAPEALAEALRLLAEGSAPRIPQDPSRATYAAKLAKDHGRIDWSEPEELVERKIRAMNPWPGSWTTLRLAGVLRKLKVFGVIRYRRDAGQPGEVLRADRNGILVGAGSGALLLRDVQLEGKRRMTAAEFLRGNPVNQGSRFDEA